MLKQPFLKAIPVLEKIEASGFEAYFVGGSVRNYLMGKKIEDVDIATSAPPQKIKRIFPKTVDIGIEHGTVLVLYGGESYEVTTFRTDGDYVDHRHPEQVSFVTSLEEDLKRRDFTMNAIAMDKEGRLIDPFDGQKDIERKLIRSVGDPAARFSEDALRMLRAVRFVSQLGFTLEDETKKALATLSPLLEHVAVERKLAEFGKLLAGTNKADAIHLIVDQGLHRYVPVFPPYGKELKKIATLVDQHPLKENEMWASIMIEIGQDENMEAFREWKMSMKQIKDIRQICRAFRLRSQQDWSKMDLYRFGLGTVLSAESLYGVFLQKDYQGKLRNLEKAYHDLPLKDRKFLAVTGNDLMEWEKRKNGPWIKEMLEKIERAVVEGKVENDKLKIKEWLYH